MQTMENFHGTRWPQNYFWVDTENVSRGDERKLKEYNGVVNKIKE